MIRKETTVRNRRLVVICLAPTPGNADDAIGIWATGTGLDAEVTIVVRDIPGIVGKIPQRERVSIVKIPFPEKTPTLLSEIRCLRQLLSQTRSGDNLLFSPHDSYAILATLLAMFLSGPVTTISFVHKKTQSPFRSRLRERIFGISERILFRRSKAVGATSSQAALALAKMGVPKQRLYLMPQGVDVERFWNCRKEGVSVRQKLGLPADIFLVGMRDFPSSKDDLLALLKTFSAVNSHSRIGMALVLSDRKALPHSFEDEIEKLPFKAMVLDATQANFYAAIDLLVVASFSDEAQRTLLEAMASGVPAVVVDDGNNASLVNDGVTGWVVPGGNPDAIAGKLQAIMEMPNEKVRGVGWAARQMVASNFSSSDLVAALDQLYRWGWE